MATRKISNVQLLQTLRGFNRPYFTVADLEKILDMDRDSLYVTLNRLVDREVLTRLKRGVYQSRFQSMELEKVANELYYPSYLSFESALSRYGILSQAPYTLTFATSRGSKKLQLSGREVEFKQLKDNYFFGYKLENGIYIGEPEKAVLDQLYMISRGRAESEVAEWSLVGLQRGKFLQYSKRFPKGIREKANQLVSRFGEQVVGVK